MTWSTHYAMADVRRSRMDLGCFSEQPLCLNIARCDPKSVVSLGGPGVEGEGGGGCARTPARRNDALLIAALSLDG